MPLDSVKIYENITNGTIGGLDYESKLYAVIARHCLKDPETIEHSIKATYEDTVIVKLMPDENTVNCQNPLYFDDDKHPF